MKRLNYSIMLLDVLVGSIFVLFSFNGFLRYAANNWSTSPAFSDTLVQISHWPDLIIPAQNQASIAMLGSILNLCFLGLWIYLGAIILLALFRLKPAIAANGILGFTTGISSIAILGWIGVILAAIIGILISIGAFIYGILLDILNFLLPYIGWIGLILGGAFVIGAIIWGAIEFWKKYGVKGVGAFLGVSALLYFIWPSLLPILRWIGSVLESILGFIAVVIAWIIKIIIILAIVLAAIGLVLGFVGSAGHLLIDQIKATWRSGTGQRGILLGSFAVGLSMALILWVSSGSLDMSKTVEQAWQSTTILAKDISPVDAFNTLLPASIVEASPKLFRTATAPIFDAIVLLIMLLVSYLGILRGIRPKEEDKFHTIFVSQDLIKLGGALVLALPAVALFLLAAVAPKED